MKIEYQKHRFNKASLDIIEKANHIIHEYDLKGYSLTLRQLYYQFVARDFIPNTQKSYKNLGNIINKGRLSGLINWISISDITRSLNSVSTWDNPEDIINSALNSYHVDKWRASKTYLEVWVEKDALIEVIEKASFYYQVSCFSCRGYVSQSAMWEASNRFIRNDNKKCYLLHLGDHDPSGIDMTRDISDRLEMFRADVKIIRIALNMDQVEKYNPPPNPAKITDSRYQPYADKFGEESWELDALDPVVIDKLIKKYIVKYMDYDSYSEAIEKEKKDKDRLYKIVNMMEDGDI